MFRRTKLSSPARGSILGCLFASAGLLAASSCAIGGTQVGSETVTETVAITQADESPTLRIGDKAMNLAPEIVWMRNMFVPEFLEGTVYVVYLWSPDSPSSMGSFPQLHGIYESLKNDGVVTISIAIDLAEGGFEPLDVVQSRGELMQHTVTEDRGTYIKDHWYTPTGYETLPVVFVIDQNGIIAFMDTKLSQVEAVARDVLAGEWNNAEALAEFHRIRDLEGRMDQVIEDATAAAMKGNWSLVLDCAEQLLEADKSHYYKMAMTKFMLNLTKLNKPGVAYEWGYQIIDDHIKNDSGMLVTMAETIVFSDGIPFRDYNLARKAAQRADELTGGQLAQVKNALAASWSGLGEMGSAIEAQMEAVRLAPTSDIKQSYQTTLDRYLNQVPSP